MCYLDFIETIKLHWPYKGYTIINHESCNKVETKAPFNLYPDTQSALPYCSKVPYLVLKV